MGVVEGDPTFLKVETHAEPGRQRVGEACGRGGAVVPGAVPMVAVAVLGQVDLPHPHGEETERRSRVQVVLRAAVMAAVWVVAEGAHKEEKRPVTTNPRDYGNVAGSCASHRGLAMSCGR